MIKIYLIIVLVLVYLVYRVTFAIPKAIKRSEDKISMLELHLDEIEVKLNRVIKKLDKNK